MSNFMQLEIITPEGVIFNKPVSYLKVPGLMGEMAFLFNHLPIFTALRIGVLEIETERHASRTYLATSGGFLEMLDNRILILAETAEFAPEINLSRAEQAEKRARERLESSEGVNVERAKLSLARALNRIKVRSGYGG